MRPLARDEEAATPAVIARAARQLTNAVSTAAVSPRAEMRIPLSGDASTSSGVSLLFSDDMQQQTASTPLHGGGEGFSGSLGEIAAVGDPESGQAAGGAAAGGPPPPSSRL